MFGGLLEALGVGGSQAHDDRQKADKSQADKSQADKRRSRNRGATNQDRQSNQGVPLYASEDSHEAQGKLSNGQWACPVCTFINQPLLNTCEVCGSRRSAAPTSLPVPAPMPVHGNSFGHSSRGSASPEVITEPIGSRSRDLHGGGERQRSGQSSATTSPAARITRADLSSPHLPHHGSQDSFRGHQRMQHDPFELMGQNHHDSRQDSPRSPNRVAEDRQVMGRVHSDDRRQRDVVVRVHSEEQRQGRASEARAAPQLPSWAPGSQSQPQMRNFQEEELLRSQPHSQQQHSQQQHSQQQHSQQQQQRQRQRHQLHWQEEDDDQSLIGTMSRQQKRPTVFGGIAGGRLRVHVLRAFNLRNTDLGILPGDVSDPFVVAKMGSQEFKTEVIENNLNPVWKSAQFDFSIQGDDATLLLEVFSSSQWHAHDSLGKMSVLVQNLAPGETHTVFERLDEGDIVRDDGLQARLEVEVTLSLPEQVAGSGVAGARPTIGGVLPTTLATPQRKVQNWVPLPSFHKFGPEAFEAPKLEDVDATLGKERKMAEYESMASRLGQYDYSSDPAYYPKQEEIDKRSWKEDPFYGWRRDLKNQEQMAPSVASRSVAMEHSKANSNELWHKDPFHGWLKHDKEGLPEHGLERMQEARMAREVMALPSFREADVKRFNDHREYSGLHCLESRARWGVGRVGPEVMETPEQRWRDDAFFGWLPGRGPEDATQSTLHRPLEQARLNRLPSFSDDPGLRGITGRGVGILRVWINAAFDLAYSEGSGLRGKPSACVKLRLGRNKEQMTQTVATDHNPCWNTPATVFEVVSTTDKLRLEVLDLANPRGQSHIHQYFLGQLELEVREIQDEFAQRQVPRGQPLHLMQELHGSQRRARLDFEVLYEPYDTDSNWSGRARHHGRNFSVMSFRSNNSSEAQGYLGVLSVRVIAAYHLVNTDSGLFGDVSDPYVTLRLGSQHEKQRKRTNTINNNLNPEWNSTPFLFPIYKDDDTLHLEVFDEDTYTSDDFLGRLIVPLYRIIRGQPNTAVGIKDRLQDIQHGELQVEIGFSPG